MSYQHWLICCRCLKLHNAHMTYIYVDMLTTHRAHVRQHGFSMWRCMWLTRQQDYFYFFFLKTTCKIWPKERRSEQKNSNCERKNKSLELAVVREVWTLWSWVAVWGVDRPDVLPLWTHSVIASPWLASSIQSSQLHGRPGIDQCLAPGLGNNRFIDLIYIFNTMTCNIRS